MKIFSPFAVAAIMVSACAHFPSAARRTRLDAMLLAAAEKRNALSAKALIAQGADPNSSDLAGRTALYWAADQGDLKMTKLLVRAGANVNLAAQDGQTPLDRASLRVHAEVMRYLIKHDASASN
ncbi:MAG: ankyrin repeat domain-containing protein [Elusimicrobiota bacterium]